MWQNIMAGTQPAPAPKIKRLPALWVLSPLLVYEKPLVQDKMSQAMSCGMGLQKCSEAVENQSKHMVLTHLFTFGAFQSTNTICSLARDKTRCYKGTGKLKSEESLIMVIFACSDVDNGISANYGVPKHISNEISATDVRLLGHQRIPYSHKRLLT